MSMQPPALSSLYECYLKDNPNKQLRLGQYFYNKYLTSKISELKHPYNIDVLYNSTNLDEIFRILEQMYKDYQWDY